MLCLKHKHTITTHYKTKMYTLYTHKYIQTTYTITKQTIQDTLISLSMWMSSPGLHKLLHSTDINLKPSYLVLHSTWIYTIIITKLTTLGLFLPTSINKHTFKQTILQTFKLTFKLKHSYNERWLGCSSNVEEMSSFILFHTQTWHVYLNPIGLDGIKVIVYNLIISTDDSWTITHHKF